MPHRKRLLGFAFASADLLVELSPEGTIAFAIGASEALSGASADDLIGKDWGDFVDPGDRAMLAMLLQGLEPGRRAGPIVARLASPDRAVAINAFRLPENRGAVSCALTRARYEPGPAPGELTDRARFEALTSEMLEAARGAGRDLEVALVELSGLAAARDHVRGPARAKLDADVAALMRAQAWGGVAATELESERFAVVRAQGETPEALSARIETLTATLTPTPIVASAGAIALEGPTQPHQLLKALRFALDSFGAQGAAWPAPADLSQALNAALDKALSEAGALEAAIRRKAFRLAYQPVVELTGRNVHHFEVLVRFGEEQSPFPQIRMAEQLELIQSLDFAILEQAAAVMRDAPGLKLAVNVSGRTIGGDRYVDEALALLAADPSLKGRLMFELTESAAIDDLATADRRLQALRGAGCEVCLDDFGVGTASLAYIRELGLDLVKVDGHYIRDLQYDSRGSTFLKHVVALCRELKLRTVAEMVENTAVEDEVRRLSFDYAQGWLYGLAADKPVAPSARNQWRPMTVQAR